MTRIDEIRARLAAYNNYWTGYSDDIANTDALKANAPADIVWLLEEIKRLKYDNGCLAQAREDYCKQWEQSEKESKSWRDVARELARVLGPFAFAWDEPRGHITCVDCSVRTYEDHKEDCEAGNALRKFREMDKE